MTRDELERRAKLAEKSWLSAQPRARRTMGRHDDEARKNDVNFQIKHAITEPNSFDNEPEDAAKKLGDLARDDPPPRSRGRKSRASDPVVYGRSWTEFALDAEGQLQPFLFVEEHEEGPSRSLLFAAQFVRLCDFAADFLRWLKVEFPQPDLEALREAARDSMASVDSAGRRMWAHASALLERHDLAGHRIFYCAPERAPRSRTTAAVWERKEGRFCRLDGALPPEGPDQPQSTIPLELDERGFPTLPENMISVYSDDKWTWMTRDEYERDHRRKGDPNPFRRPLQAYSVPLRIAIALGDRVIRSQHGLWPRAPRMLLLDLLDPTTVEQALTPREGSAKAARAAVGRLLGRSSNYYSTAHAMCRNLTGPLADWTGPRAPGALRPASRDAPPERAK